MRFVFVDSILQLKKGTSIKGTKTISFEECFLSHPYQEEGFFPKLLVLEAVAQLASWLVIYSTDFKYQPVILKMDKVEMPVLIKAGTKLILEAEIEIWNEDGAVINGIARVGEDVIARGQHCLCQNILLAQFADPETVKVIFKELSEKAIIT